MIITGHRGAKGLAPENTLASIKAALDNGAGEVEIDVYVTKDGVPVLSHDPVEIAITDYNQLVIATLTEAILLIDREVPLIIEVKPKVPIGPVVFVVNKFLDEGWQPSDFAFASFSQKTLRELHSALPGITKIVNEEWSSIRAVRRMKQVDTKRVSMNQRFLWFGFVRAMSRRGYQLNTYALNNVKKARRWQRYGLYATITDYPDRFA